MKNRFRCKPLLPLLFVILAVPTVSIAGVNKGKEQVETISISISDLDLSQKEGIVTLYERLKSSAGKVCGAKDGHVTGSRIASLKIKRQYKKCYARALNGAVQGINNKSLTELHGSNT